MFPSRSLVELDSACYFPFFYYTNCFDGCLSGATTSRFFSLLSHFNLQSFEVHRDGKKRKFRGFSKILKITVKAGGVGSPADVCVLHSYLLFLFEVEVFDHLGKGRGRAG